MTDSRDDDSAPAPPLAGFGQQLRNRFRDLLGDDLDKPRDKTPGEAANFSDLSAEEQTTRRKQVSAARQFARMTGKETPGPEYGAIDELWVTGKITREERRDMRKKHRSGHSTP